MKENAKNNEKYLPPLAAKITDSNTHKWNISKIFQRI